MRPRWHLCWTNSHPKLSRSRPLLALSIARCVRVSSPTETNTARSHTLANSARSRRAQPAELLREQKALGDDGSRPASETKERKKTRGRSKLSMKLKKKRKNVIDLEKAKLIEKLEEEKKRRRIEAGSRGSVERAPGALRRFSAGKAKRDSSIVARPRHSCTRAGAELNKRMTWSKRNSAWSSRSRRHACRCAPGLFRRPPARFQTAAL